jgi:hypothetical protein
MRTPTKKRKTPIKETKSVSVSTTSTPVKTSPKARRNLKLSDVEEEDVAMLKGEKEKKTVQQGNTRNSTPTTYSSSTIAVTWYLWYAHHWVFFPAAKISSFCPCRVFSTTPSIFFSSF